MKHLESGRSIVEMLGVLAVMGIISIGGLYGYTYAMKRHRANELLNEANKRAVMVASQLMAGKDPEDVNIDEFPTNTPYGTFPTKITPKGSDKFSISVSGLDEDTCQYMEELAGAAIRKIKCEEDDGFSVEFTFNNDLSTEERASDFTTPETCKSPYKWCSGSSTCTQDESCTCSGEKPACKVCDTTTGGYSIDEEDDIPCKTNSTLTEEDGTCQSGICVKTPNDNCPSGTTVKEDYTGDDALNSGNCMCTSYQTNQCGSNYYCHFTPSNCTDSGVGVCSPLTSGTESNGYIISPELDWWSANSWCVGQTGHGLVKSLGGMMLNKPSYSAYNEDAKFYEIIGRTGDFWTGNEYTTCEAIFLTSRSNYDGLSRAEQNGDLGLFGNDRSFYSGLCQGEGFSEPCADYPGTGLSNTTENGVAYSGGIAAEIASTECRCPSGKYWDPSAQKCIIPHCPTGTTIDTAYQGSENALDEEGCVCDDYQTNQCGTNYFCYFRGGSLESAPDYGTGICQPIMGREETKQGDYIGIPTELNGYAIGPSMNWWSANSWCISKTGHGLVTESLNGVELDNTAYDNKEGNGPLYSVLGAEGYYWTGYKTFMYVGEKWEYILRNLLQIGYPLCPIE